MKRNACFKSRILFRSDWLAVSQGNKPKSGRFCHEMFTRISGIFQTICLCAGVYKKTTVLGVVSLTDSV